MSVATASPFGNLLRQMPGYGRQIAYTTQRPARVARHATPDPPLPPPLQERLTASGRWPLYTHQLQALAAARREDHVGVITGTASGKSLCYTLPTLETLLHDPAARALLLAKEVLEQKGRVAGEWITGGRQQSAARRQR